MTTGLLLLDKPLGPTSHDLVQRTRRLAGTRRVGHAGTLDPAASGLMILGVNGATRLLTYLVGLDKTYEATIRLGTATTTDDAEGTPVGEPATVTEAVRARIPQEVAALTGAIDQVPSSVSAVHVDGRRAHELVRAGEAVDLPSRRVTIRRFEVLAVRDDELDVVVDCSSGTYIRALARDLGAALGVGGHLTALRRTRVGPFDVADAPPLEEPLALRSPAAVAEALFPVLHLDDAQRIALQQGKRLPTELPDAPVVAALADGVLIGLVEVAAGRTRVLMNLPPEQVAP
ncbi:tRNA pseudouridine(55) synthase TruB [Amnibacterium soli]|uniref:tRNA pseudouridine synthase B n=1 Tax=Amnibacterium soli TaxID=1282736 RepID=A0ABP8YVC4_9MICO